MLPRLFPCDSFALPTYGVLVALGFVAALIVIVRLAGRGEALARKEKEAEEMQKSFKGRDGACLFRREVVRGFLERWSKGELSLEDYKRAEKCEGRAAAFP